MLKNGIDESDNCETIGYNEIVGLIFSKDRAMQLDALLRSISLNCRDIEKVDLKVLYTTSNAHFDEQYQRLKDEYGNIEFIKETDFREQVLSCIPKYPYVLFLVDDDIFVNDFSIKSIITDLSDNSDALGFSLRLGENTGYCYTLYKEQKLPVFTALQNMTLKYCWIGCEYDFGYPLEISSSVYRVGDILPLLIHLPFSNPNTMEANMSLNSAIYSSERPHLLCCKTSLLFNNPVNMVQTIWNNRVGSQACSTVHDLGDLFDKGLRVDAKKYKGFIASSSSQEVDLVFYNSFENEDSIKFLISNGFVKNGEPLRVHLGCGEQHFPGYVNIDYPPDKHNVMNVAADVYADITKIDFPPESIDEVRLHAVFEHFNRVTALAMLIKWHSWLKVGGILRIETPDILASSKTLLSDVSFNVKMGVVRHLAGDQSADWAYHVDQWFPERFTVTLQNLGFEIVEMYSKTWDQEPFLSNVEVIAKKTGTIPRENLLKTAETLLWYSTVSPSEKKTFDIWKKQLKELLNTECKMSSGREEIRGANYCRRKIQDSVLSAGTSNLFGLVQDKIRESISLEQVHNFNQLTRDEWVRTKSITVPKGYKVIDVGAGTCPYRSLFKHCEYYSHDFKQYNGIKLGGTSDYGDIDIVSSIESIPVDGESFDVILCTEVLEHVPEPALAINEMARILKPGGRILITAPLGSGLHQLPYHYYGGFTPHWYKYFFEKNGLKVTEILANGGFFKHLAQECARVAWTFDLHKSLHEDKVNYIYTLFNEELPRYLYNLDEKCPIPEFTTGYFIEGVKEK